MRSLVALYCRNRVSLSYLFVDRRLFASMEDLACFHEDIIAPPQMHKYLLKRQSKEEKREQRHQLLKQKAESCRERRKNRNISMFDNMTSEEKQKHIAEQKALHQQYAANLLRGHQHGIRCCVDLGFDIVHNKREVHSLAQQLRMAYTHMKYFSLPISLHISSLANCAAVYATLQSQGVVNWKATLHENSAFDVFSTSELVILSPDAEEVLDTLEHDKVYVIGGIVDRTVQKNVTLTTALDYNIRCMRLPIQEHLTTPQNTVLNIDTVVALLSCVSSGQTWSAAIEATLPKRKKERGGKKKRYLEKKALERDSNSDSSSLNSEQNSEDVK